MFGVITDGKEVWRDYSAEFDLRPTMTFEKGTTLVRMSITNASMNVNTMMYGDGYSVQPDGILDLWIYGYDSEGNATGRVKQNLGNGTDILDEWAVVDLTSLLDATELRFAFESDQFSNLMIYYPPLFAFDDIVDRVNATPEPATLAILGLGLAGQGLARRRK